MKRLFGVSFALLITTCCLVGAAQAGPLVALDTTMGRIVVELDLDKAPVSSRNFMRYVSEGHYDGTLFHRVVEGFVVQGGGLTPDMKDKPTHEAIVNEARNGLSNVAGSLAMARENAVDSATAQFFINVVDNPRLDHVEVPPGGVTVKRRARDVLVLPEQADTVFGYAVFGRVVQGMDVVERIRHVPVRTIGRGEDTFENVPVDPVVIVKAAPLASLQRTTLSHSTRNASMADNRIKLHTNHGDITIELDEAKAPKSAANFVAYVKKGHYDGTVFHRVINGFMVQGGGFAPGMKQKPTDDTIVNEADNGLKNDKYTVAMARTNEPHSASAQFFINVADNEFLNHTAPTSSGWGYAVFGKVVEGTEIVDKIKSVKTSSAGGHRDVPVEDVVIERAEVV